MELFKKLVKESTNFKGRPIVNGELSKTYKRFVKEQNGNAPLPSDIFYNTLTKRFVKSSKIFDKRFKKKKVLRQQFKKIYKVEKNKIVLRTKEDIFVFSMTDEDWSEKWIDYLWKNRDKFNSKNTQITLYYFSADGRLQWDSHSSPVGKFLDGKKLRFTIRNIVYKGGGSDGMSIIDVQKKENYEFKQNFGIPYAKFVQYTPIQTKLIQQQYKDGLDYHCVLQPIKQWCEKLRDNAKSKNTQKKYDAILNKLIGKETKSKKKCGFFEKYKDGCTRDDLQELCDELNIGINICSPFYAFEIKKSESKPVFTFKPKNDAPRKVFTYINNRLNHLENLKSTDVETIELTAKQMRNQLQHEKDSIFSSPIFQTNGKGQPTKIFTFDKKYVLEDDSKDIIHEFEKKANLKDNFLYSNHPLYEFVYSSVHFGGMVNFEKEDDEDTDYKVKHIDQKKSYYNFKKCPIYDGFCYKPSIYGRNLNKEFCCNRVGFYKVDNLNVSHSPYQTLLERMNLFENNRVYPHVMLKLMDFMKIDFTVKEGVYGERFDFDFGEDMLKKFKDGKEDEKEGQSLYSLWTGRQHMNYKENRFSIYGDKEFLQTIAYEAEMIGCESKVYIDNFSRRAVITTPKPVVRNRSHICSYITAYSSITTILQLLHMDIDNVLRVNVDGIYYKYQTPTLIGSFRIEKKEYRYRECGDNEFLSNYPPLPVEEYEKEYDNEQSKFTNIEGNVLFAGAGGTGKSYMNLNNQSYNNILYMAHSHKLCSYVKEKGYNVAPHAHVLVDNPEYIKRIREKADVVIWDEVSTNTIFEIKKAKRILKGIPIIFLGDIGYQVRPFSDDKEYSKELAYKEFNEIITLTKNYRFTDIKHNNICNKVRKMMDEEPHKVKDYCIAQYGKVKFENVKKDIRVTDMILSSTHKRKDVMTNKLKDILPPKYIMTKNYDSNLCNGMILYERPKIPASQYEIRYAYTIHSIQGETLEDDSNLYIDIKNLWDNNVIYTAISRARRHDQIKFICFDS